jgi:enterochelin esterase-like enzyme
MSGVFCNGHRNTRRTCGTWRKNLPFKQNYLPQVLLISDEFEILSLTELENICLLPHDYDDSEERYPVMYLQDAQNLFNGMPNTAIGKLTKAGVMSEYKIGKIIIIAIEH